MPFAEKSLCEFSELLASSAPVPGGGGASALVGALGAALASMVANLTTGKKKYAEYEDDIGRILEKSNKLRLKLLSQIDEDAACFAPLAQAYSLPRNDPQTPELMERALQLACTGPLNIMKTAAEAIKLHKELSVKGSRLMISDVGAGVLFCKSALVGASLNIFINLRSMKDEEYAAALRAETEALLSEYGQMADEVFSEVFEQIK
ncbi:MAG: cyclodeaminase/cyclohydrolase family protein [Clostridiales bacterium]|nr:cyclodeaminase/cyclohydrolase family protein [Clostridiales bacterium]